jgi:hypothetical protein
MFLYFLMFLLLFENVIEIPEKILIHQIVVIPPKIFFSCGLQLRLFTYIFSYVTCLLLYRVPDVNRRGKPDDVLSKEKCLIGKFRQSA